MATTKKQRWGILVILVVTVIGTIGSFAVMILSTKNDAADAAKLQRVQDEYSKSYDAYQKKVNDQAAKLSEKYYAEFSQYQSRVGTFNRDDVKEIKMEDLKVGDGEEITDTTGFSAYYIGWNPLGKVFDGSIEGKSLKAPLGIDTGLAAASLIDGWKEGMKGMRINGVREITIPSDKAYGERGSGDNIPPNTPLKFVVMAIPMQESIPQPTIPQELYQGLGNQ